MKYLYYLNPVLLFLMSLLFFTARNHQHMDLGILGDMAGMAVLFLIALGLLVYACVRNLRETYKAMTYIAILWLVYPLLVVLPFKFIFEITGLETAISYSLAGLITFCGLVLVILMNHKKLPFSETFQKAYFIFGVIVLSIQIPHLVALAKYGNAQNFIFNDVEIALAGRTPVHTPHIIYIVPDRYANNENLKQYYNYDNSGFSNDLRARGFDVSDDQFANYTKTFQSLGSLLNMNYLDDMAHTLGRDAISYNPVYEVLKDNQVQRILRRDGYQFTNMGNWWEPTRINPYANENISGRPISEYMLNYMQLTPLRYFFPRNIQALCDLVEQQKAQVLKAVQRDKPQFVFWHLFSVHDPYMYDENGNCFTKQRKNWNWDKRKEVYKQHINLTNEMLLRLYDDVKKHSSHDVIFAIQSDEGPYPLDYLADQSGYKFMKAPPGDLDMKFGIFDAVYAPESYNVHISGQATPINNFRQILSVMYGTQLPMLPHKTMVFNQEDYPYDLHDISDGLY